MAGLTATGFVRKRLEDILLEQQARLRAAFGDDVDVSPQSVFGQLLGVFAQPAADCWEVMEQVYLSQYRDSAEGVSLEGAVANIGISRLGAARSTVTASVTGDEGTVIPLGTLFRGSDSTFVTTEPGLITQDSLDRMQVQIDAVAPGNTYTISIDGVPVTIVATTSNPNTTAQEIATAINGSTTAATAVTDGNKVNVLAKGVPFVGLVNSAGGTFTITEIASQVPAQSVSTGSYDVSVGALTSITTPIVGADSVTNRKAGVRGRVIESDADLRRRARQGARGVGAASVESIRARLLQDVPNLLSANVFENRTDAVDSFGRPPHSFEVVVEGAEDRDVARAIWRLKPAGITMFGNTTVPITDIAGSPQDVLFSRPQPLYMSVRVTIVEFDGEETFPATGTQQIADNIVLAGNRLAAGMDVIVQRLFSAVYQVPGLAQVIIEVGADVDPNASPVLSENNIIVPPAQRAQFALGRVEVVTP